jgi:hypothetical protein
MQALKAQTLRSELAVLHTSHFRAIASLLMMRIFQLQLKYHAHETRIPHTPPLSRENKQRCLSNIVQEGERVFTKN